jgi:tetratricopeptide (TPR) repeat protein
MHRKRFELTEALRLDPSLAIAYRERGSCHFQKGEYGRAVADLRNAILIDPRGLAEMNCNPYNDRATCYLKNRRIRQCHRRLDRGNPARAREGDWVFQSSRRQHGSSQNWCARCASPHGPAGVYGLPSFWACANPARACGSPGGRCSLQGMI